MTSGMLKGIGAACFVVCAVLLFVAWERYNDNAKKVEAMNRLMQGGPFGGNAGFGGLLNQAAGNARMEPGVPTATTYALVFAGLSAIGGVVCFMMAGKMPKNVGGGHG